MALTATAQLKGNSSLFMDNLATGSDGGAVLSKGNSLLYLRQCNFSSNQAHAYVLYFPRHSYPLVLLRLPPIWGLQHTFVGLT